MLIFACLICKTTFYDSKTFDENSLPKSQKSSAVLTQCGHYFHLNCLEGAFIYDKIRMESLSQPSKKSCPLPGCGKDLSQTALTKINPVKVKSLDPETEVFSQLEELKSELSEAKSTHLEMTLEIKELKLRLRNSKAPVAPGDRVVYRAGNNIGDVDCYGTVLKVRVEIQPDSNTNNDSISISNNFPWRESVSKLLHQISLSNQPNITVPAEQVNLADPMRVTRQFSSDEYSDLKSGLRPKWAAGDRIYLPLEKESATIKWIGSRHYKFIVVIEYDQPVGEDSFNSEDLPFLIKQGHGRRLTIDELSDCAQKESKSPTAILNSLVRWGTRKGKLPKRTSTFYTNNNTNDDDNL